MPETVLLKGAPLAKSVKEQVAAEMRRLGVAPRLAVVLASADPGAASYAQSKQKAAASLGINVVGDKLVGDVDEASALGKVKALTPVPGGVGTLTTAIIFRNLLRAIRLQQGGGKAT